MDAVRVALDADRAQREQKAKTAALRTRFDALSQREKEVMRLVCSGLMNKQAAAEISVSEITVKVHRHNLMRKLGAKSLPELVRMADMLGLPRSREPKTVKPRNIRIDEFCVRMSRMYNCLLPALSIMLAAHELC